jgi:hypothetical protein
MCSFVCILTLKVICSVTHLHSYKNCRVTLKREGLDLRDFGIRDGFQERVYRVKGGLSVL